MTYVVLSGLPGSGKSTLATRLAPTLGISVLDKDDILDRLFDARGIGDTAWRAALSREADASFAEEARQMPACLVSWWRHPLASSGSGTPIEWLAMLSGPVVEVHCVCPPEVAVERFLRRRRHPGHLDASRTRETLIEQFRTLDQLGPLNCGPALEVRTDLDIDVASLCAWVRARQALGRAPSAE